MPRPELPRHVVSVTLTERQLARLDELANLAGRDEQNNRETTLIAALAAFDVMVKSNLEIEGQTVFGPHSDENRLVAAPGLKV